MSADTKKRTMAKTITWRITASLTTFLIAWMLTGDILIGASIGGMEARYHTATRMLTFQGQYVFLSDLKPNIKI